MRTLVTACLALACGCAPAAASAPTADPRIGPDGVLVLRVTSAVSTGPGSIREAIETANQTGARPTRIVFDLDPDAAIYVFLSLPAITGSRVEIDGKGVTIRGGSCNREDGKKGCSGLTVRGSEIVLRNLTIEGFTFDGVSVIGPRAREVRILSSVFRDNLDDGVGISAAAQAVLVEDCELTGNGFRTKGKGILVFDGSRATLRRNVVRGNRDGVTISRNAEAYLDTNRIEDNYDKGLGVSGAVLRGKNNYIARNGRVPRNGEEPPNADGLRVGLTSSVQLVDTTIESNGDSGVVAMNDSTVILEGGHAIANGGYGVVVTGSARVSLDRFTLAQNAKGHIDRSGEGMVIGVPR